MKPEHMNPTRTILLCFALLVACAPWARAQQEAQYTQFTHDKLYFNPAYAGARGATTVGLIARAQWVGFEGAPLSQALRAHIPLARSRVGLGLSVDNDIIGFSRSTGVKLAYSYRLKLGKRTRLNLGVDASVREYRVDYSTARRGDLVDFTLASEVASLQRLPSVGAGAFLYEERFYLGVSVPRMTRGIIFAPGGGRGTGLSVEVPHLFLMGGVDLPASREIHVRPSFNAKYAPKAPLSLDLNVMTVLRERVAIGGGYRGGGLDAPLQPAALDAIVQVMPHDELTIGIAYGYPLSRLGGQQAGSFEALVEYTFLHPRRRRVKCYYF